MSEYNEVLWCPDEWQRTAFNLSGSGTKGVCLSCGLEIEGGNYVRELREMALIDYNREKKEAEEKHLKLFDFMFSDIKKIAK